MKSFIVRLLIAILGRLLADWIKRLLNWLFGDIL